MPDFIFPLILLITLAGFIFLFLQNRGLANEISLLRESAMVASRVPLPREPAAFPKDLAEQIAQISQLKALDARITEVLAEVHGTSEALATFLEKLDRTSADSLAVLNNLVEEVARKEEARPEPDRAAGAGMTLEEAVRDVLTKEGCTAVSIVGTEESGTEVRVTVRAKRGGFPEAGTVAFDSGVLKEVRLRPLTRMFP
jgi:hypothetical protein